jgi:hypothetical protein
LAPFFKLSFFGGVLCVCRAWFYCKACHEDIKDETLIKKCKCKNCKLNFQTLDYFFLLLLLSIEWCDLNRPPPSKPPDPVYTLPLSDLYFGNIVWHFYTVTHHKNWNTLTLYNQSHTQSQ